MGMRRSRLKRGTKDEGRGTRDVHRPSERSERSSIIHRNNGFTLIELLITTGIMGIVALAIFSTLAGGLNVYSHVKSYKGIQVDVLISLEKIERDLRSAFVFSQVDFMGEKHMMSFPALIKTVDAGGNQSISPGRITYYYDSIKDKLIREEQDYSLAILGKYKNRGMRRVLTSAKDVKFSYFCYDASNETYEWVNLWKPEDEGRGTRDEGRGTRDEGRGAVDG